MILPDVIEQHWEEAGLLWSVRSAATIKANFSLVSLGELDERVEAHLDGLRVAGQEGWDLCRRVAVWEEPGEAFAAGVLASEAADTSLLDEVVAKAATKPILARGLVSALGWVDLSVSRPRIQRFLAAASPGQRRIGLSAAAIQRMPLNGALGAVLKDADVALRARACRAVGELGQRQLAGLVAANLSSESEDCSFWAAWSLCLLGPEPAASARLREYLQKEPPWSARATDMLFRRLDLSASLALVRELAKTPAHARLAIQGAAVIGDPVLIPALLEQLDAPERQRLAADAFQTITGADFIMDRLRNGSPPRPPVPEDDGAEYVPDPDEGLTWPAPKAVREWWSKHRDRFQAGTRYLLGKPMAPEWLREVLASGQQHQRAAAALELAMRSPGQPLFNTKAPAARQFAALAQFKAPHQP